MTSTARDHIWSITLDLARARYERGYLREFTPETVATVVDEEGVGTSLRTVRRVLDAMSDLGVLEDVSEDGERLYRWIPRGDVGPSSDMSELDSDDKSVDGLQETRESVSLGPSRAFEDERIIYHLYADTGVESEPLSAYGEVVRVGLDPDENRFSIAVQADATEPPLAPVADLVVCHPYCQRWSPATRIQGTQEEYPNQIPDARETGRRLGDHYIIENVPDAPLEDPVVLDGRAFGLPVPYRRAFETSFEVPEPPVQASIEERDREPFEKDDGTLGVFLGDLDYWRTVKQVSGDYPSKALKHSGIPSPYIHYLAYHWLRAVDDEDDRQLEETVAADGGRSE